MYRVLKNKSRSVVPVNKCLCTGYFKINMEDIQPALRSLYSEKRIYIRLMNLTNRRVDIIWISYTGEYVMYKRLDCGAFLDINTFESHPWIAVDSDRKDRMLIDKEFIYMPKTWREYFRNAHPNVPIDSISPNVEPRLLVAVTIPVYSLRARTLLEVRSYVKTASDVDMLDLPKELSTDLKLLLLERNRFVF